MFHRPTDRIAAFGSAYSDAVVHPNTIDPNQLSARSLNERAVLLIWVNFRLPDAG